MKNDYFESLEQLSQGHTLPLAEILQKLQFNSQGLIPVITQHAETGEVLMMAWMNQEVIEKTLSTGRMTYWSRSRNQVWVKGETSGHVQQLKAMRVDCDGDTLLCLADQVGAACHTGRQNCFYFEVDYPSQSVSITSSVP